MKMVANSLKNRKYCGKNTVQKGEIAHKDHFPLFPQCFQKVYTPDTYKQGFV